MTASTQCSQSSLASRHLSAFEGKMFPTPARRADVKKRNAPSGTPFAPDSFASPAPQSRPQKSTLNSPIPMAPLGPRTPAPARKSVFTRENERHSIEVIAPFPQQVKEVASSQDPHVSGNLDAKSGIAWVVYRGNNGDYSILSWRFRKSAVAKNDVYRVSMGPSSPLHAKLATPLPSNRASSSGSFPLLACTTQGHLRFWKSAADGMKFNEERVDLHQEESCTTLTATPDETAFILVTSHLRVFLVSLYDEYNLQVKELKKPESFGGLFSFLNTGRSKVQHTVKRVIATPRHDGRCNLVILSNHTLQWWVLSGYAGNYVCLYDKSISQELSKHLFDGSLPPETAVEPVDVQISSINNSGRSDRDVLVLYLLFAERLDVSASFQDTTFQITYRLWGLELAAPMSAASASANQFHSGVLNQVSSKQTLAFRPQCAEGEDQYYINDTHFILPSESRAGYILNFFDIIFTRLPNDERPLDLESLRDSSNIIIGAGELDKYGLAMIAPHGIARLMQPGVDMYPDAKPSAMDVDSFGVDPSAQNLEAVLARAFKLFGTNDSSYRMMIDMHRRGDWSAAVLKFAESIVDAPPTGDPRWAEDPQQHNSYQHSLALISQHLEEKRRRYLSFLLFLAKADLFQSVNRGTLAILSEYREKVAAAILLRNIQSSSEIWAEVSDSIKDVLDQRNVNIEEWQQSGFGPQDVFFSKVSRIEDILFKAQARQHAMLSSRGANFKSIHERFEIIGRTNQIFEAILSPSQVERHESRGTFFPAPTASAEGDILSDVWTCSEAIRRALVEQITSTKIIGMELKRAFNQTSAVANTVDSAALTASDLRDQLEYLVSQLANLTNVLLGDYTFQLLLLGEAVDAGIAGAAAAREQLDGRFDEIRRQTIQYFSDLEQYDRALGLAEQYADFNTLVKMCDSTGDQRRLNHYLQTHGASFAFFLFAWYEANSKFEKLLQQPPELWELLSEYLSSKPALLWLHQTSMGNWLGAAQTLEKLGLAERQSFETHHRYLSLAKLNYQAAGVSSENAALLDDFLLLCRIQARLLDMFKNDSRLAVPLSPKNLVTFIVEHHRSDIVSSTDFFLLASDAVIVSNRLISNEEHTDLLVFFWDQCIRSYAWEELAAMDSSSNLSDIKKEEHLRLTQLYAVVSDPARSSMVPSRARLENLLDSIGMSAHARRLAQAAYNFGIQAAQLILPPVELSEPSTSFAEYNTPMKL